MKSLFSTLIILCIACALSAQTIVTGKVTDKKGNPLVGVNIYFKGTYDGTVSDVDGDFSALTNESDISSLIFSFIGYKPYVLSISSDTINYIAVILKESNQSLDAVEVTAGNFAAGDKHKASVMKSRDIYTTAGAVGSIAGALKTLPGVQQAGDDGRLLVRGGESYETKTIIDGMLAAEPYYSKLPSSSTRSRFSPSLFSGTIFNTGGYSAEYGQALSSVLVLDTHDLFTENLVSFSLMSIGTEANYTKCWKNNSLSVKGSYINYAPYYGFVKNTYDWVKPTEIGSGSFIYRHKTKKNGMLKAYFTSSKGDSRFDRDSGVEDIKYTTELKTDNDYGNITFKQPLGEKLSIKTGASITIDNSDVTYYKYQIESKKNNIEVRAVLIHDVAEGIKLKYGVSNTFTNYDQKYSLLSGSILYEPAYVDFLTGTFAETQIQVSQNIAFSAGLRYEFSSLLIKSNISPRLGIAIATGKKSQLSASFGHFYQNPQSDQLKFSSDLNFEKATHYMLGFQTGSLDERFFRVESYYKKYDSLVKYDGDEYYNADYYSNYGYGDAKGFDVFFKDTKSLKFLEYRLSYSYIDTHRNYKYYDNMVQPSYISNHNFSAVGKYWISALHCQLGATFWMASGRNWYDMSSAETVTHRAKTTKALNLSLSYLTSLFGNQITVHASLSNVFGQDNIYTYDEGPISNSDGSLVYLPITDDVKQSAFIGIFITLK